MHTRHFLVALVLFALAGNAYAAREFSWNAGTCAPASTTGEAEVDLWETDTDMPFHSYGTNRPEKSTTTFGDAQNVCSHQFVAASATTNYVGRTVAPSTTPVMATYLKVTTAPATRRKIMSFVKGCMLTLEADPSISGNSLLKVFFDETDTSEGICQGSLNNETKCDIGCSVDADCNDRGFDSLCGTDVAGVCAIDSECPNTEPGESGCAEGAFGQYTFPNTDWQIVTLGQTNGTGKVTCKLWAGAPGSSRQRGAGTHTVESCIGDDNEACTTNADCATSNCSTTKVVAITEVRWGTDDTVADAADYLLDSFLYDSSSETGMVNYRMPELVPNDNTGTQQWTSTGCSGSDAACVDETGTNASPDEGNSYLGETATLENEDLGFEDITLGGTCSTTCSESNIACTVNADCTEITIPSVSVVAIIRDQGNPVGGSTKTLQLCALDNTGATESCGPAANVSDQSTTDYMPNAYAVFVLNPDGGAFGEADVDALRVRMKYVESGAVGSVRATTVHLIPEISMPDPPVPTNITDNNGDGQDTVTFTSASRWLPSTFWAGVVGGLTEPLNIINCCHGGTTPGDSERDMADILKGKTTQQMSCRVQLGSTDRDADVILIMQAANGMRKANVADTRVYMKCTVDGDCPNGGTCTQIAYGTSKRCTRGQDGYCMSYCSTDSDCTVGNCTGNADCNQTGATCTCAEHGSACYCPVNDIFEKQTGTRSCITDGASALTDCDKSSDCTCSTNSDCGPFDCSGGKCTIPAAASLSCNLNTTTGPADMCLPGCKSVDGCTDGLCFAQNPVASIIQSHKDMAATIDASSTNTDAVWVMAPRAHTFRTLGCWRWTNEPVDALRSWMREWAIGRGDSFIDMDYCLRMKTPGGDIDGDCYPKPPGDNIHLSSICLQRMAECITDFFSNDAANDGVCATSAVACTTDADCGGKTCSASVCSTCASGRILDYCTSNADCHTYMRTF